MYKPLKINVNLGIDQICIQYLEDNVELLNEIFK